MGKRRGLSGKIRNWSEYLVARGLCRLSCALPSSAASALATCIAAPMAYQFFRGHRRRALENLRRVHGLDAAKNREEVLSAVFRNLALTAVEFFRFATSDDPSAIHLMLSESDCRRLSAALAHHRGLIFVTAHLGNWELLGALAIQAGSPTVHSVVRPLDNPYLESWVRSIRERAGQQIYSKKGSFWQLSAVLQQGGCVGFLADQDARWRGILIDFLGLPASTTCAPALLSLWSGAPIMPACALRKQPFELSVQFGDLIWPGTRKSPAEVKRITETYTRSLEAWIRRNPDQWLWTHRRWKTSDVHRHERQRALLVK
ncbi:MAG: lysophospholipid acyltransferase family protein [Acidobacteria bacterium]|nr:lysophospholipid acyltransferase family protein [Acidobacteriota bacterium]